MIKSYRSFYLQNIRHRLSIAIENIDIDVITAVIQVEQLHLYFSNNQVLGRQILVSQLSDFHQYKASYQTNDQYNPKH